MERRLERCRMEELHSICGNEEIRFFSNFASLLQYSSQRAMVAEQLSELRALVQQNIQTHK
jgi:hypothetical protein